jgi:hypothetical protein
MDQILGVLGMEPHEKKHDPKDRYTPPLGAPAEVTRIFELLKTITNDVRDEQKAGMVEMATKAVLNFAEAVAADDKKKMRQMIESQNGFIISRCYDIRKKELDKDWEATIEKYSENQVEEMQNQFVYKNTRKLASIASAKGGMREQKVLSVTAHQGVIEAALLFTFDDGSSFRVDQSIVFSRSVHNTPFVRFPTTFHDVIMPDGSKMGYPSEERMNEIFAKA